MTRVLVTLLALATWSAAQEKTTYDDHVFPIFQQSCLNCHNPDKAKGGLDLSTFAATMKGGSGGKIVEPGDIGCMLVGSVQQTSEKKMPPEGDKLASAQIDTIKRWIEGGLLENKSSSARKASKPKFETTLRSDPATKPDGPPPMPEHLLLEPPVVTPRAAAIHALACSPWAPLLAATGQNQVLLYHTESLELVGILPFPEGDPVSLAFTPDGRYLIVGGGVPGKSGVTITFDVIHGTRQLTVAKEFDSILAADIRPGFDIVATGGPSRLLKIWNTETGEPVKSIKKHTDWITALDLSADGVLIASGDRNGGVFVWESESGSEFHSLRAHQAAITATVFRADSNILATASEDGTLRFWEMNGGSEVKKIDAHPGGVTAFSFARDGSSASAGRDMKAKFWKPDFNHARDLVQNLPALPTAIALDSEGKRAFVGDALGRIQSFQTTDSTKLGEIGNNPPPIETRIQTIASIITEQEQNLPQSEKDLTAKTAARDSARNALNQSENDLKQLIESHKTTQDAANQAPSEEANKRVAEALSKIQPAEQTIVQNRANLENAEKFLATSTAALENIKTSINSLKVNEKRWSAAAINTKALNTSKEAESTSIATEESQSTYTQSAAAIAIQSNVLNSKRSERQELNEYLNRSNSPSLTEELQATLAALEIRISIEQDRLKQLEDESLALRDNADQTAPLAHQKNQETISLRKAYLKALE